MKKYSIYILVIAITGLGACQKDKLNPVPSTDIPDFKAFETKERITSQVNGLYSVLKNGKFLGGKFAIANEVRGEDFVNEKQNNVTLQASWKMVTTGEAQEVKELWSQGYMAINNANVFMAGMAAAGNKIVGDSIGKIYTGEAKFVRGVSYFSLLQLFARPHWDGAGSKPGLILRFDGNTKLGNYAQARSTVNEVYAQIIKDLDSAEALLPKVNPGTLTAIARANAYSAIAYKTRVYLYMEQYDKVISEAAKLVSVNAPFVSPAGHALEADIQKVFTAPYFTKESLFSLPFTISPGDFPGTQTQLGFYFTPAANPYSGNGEYSLHPNGVIADSSWKPATDARRKFIFKSGTKNYWTKFPTPSPFTDYVPVIRYAEVLLNLAEAKVRQSNAVDPTAVALLSAIRHRSDAGITYATSDFASAAALLAAIIQEKHIELLGEGFRGMEITRLGIPVPMKSSTVPATAPTASAYIWPISSDELIYNKLCVDNN
ncbi:SusD-like starch-binding protein associating with outer membrane [Chitinophaga niastensis]|uniref:SusD-like starch-binding protein associating with outer membrane n=1 Tax=Chitinophaga niastensis TaxID=536980 RepID=A0A2P8HVM8_CHINA|nr:RagB/SusD family nutrient uptake outer membrane protein [Chitinophaga niastensis]PSL50277.1 SusD-like starch-binding protein associating with outer membrane [Chitinophaga niastensis]